MNFSSPELIATTIQSLKDADRKRARNRALLDALYNGDRPFTDKEEQENHIRVNVNFGEGSDLILKAREQYENAFLSSDLYFKILVPDCPNSKRTKTEGGLTHLVNRLMKRSRPYLHTERMKWASVGVHGLGPRMWEDKWKWCPYFVAVPDLLIPTDTDLTLDGMNHFAGRRYFTPGQLFRKTFGCPKDKRDPGWNMKAVSKVLDQYKDLNLNPNNYNWADHPEAMVQLWKQNVTNYDQDAVPKIWAWDFYHQEDDEGSSCWYRKMILDTDCVAGRQSGQEEIVFLYDYGKPFADNLDQILHIQFADGNNIAPFMVHSVRGIGLRLFDTVQMLNRLRCQFMQKVFEDLMNLFHIDDPVDRARLDQIYMGLNYGAFPQALRFVTKEERYTPDANLMEMQMANLKQLLGEGSAQYTSDIDTGTNKEQTAFEVSTKLNQATKLTGSMLNLAYVQETFAYQEICRRLTLKGSPEFDVKRFQNECLEAGIDEKWINSERWEIEPVRTLGSGNTQLESAQAQALMQVRPLMNPEAQNETLHKFIFAVTHDPKLANRLAPLDAVPPITDTVHDTQLIAAALLGTPVAPKPGLNPMEAVTTMLGEMQVAVQGIMQSGGVASDKKQLDGLVLSAQYVGQWLQQLSQDKTNKQFVKQSGDRLGQIMNMVKGFGQRFMEAQRAKNGGGNNINPEVVQKLQANQAITSQKLQANAQKHQQKLIQTQQKFAAQQQQNRLRALSDVHDRGLEAGLEAGNRQSKNRTFEE